MLIICDSILVKEFQKHNNYVDIASVIEMYNRLQDGVGVSLGSPLEGCVLYKSRIVTNNGIGRIIFLLVVNDSIYTPVMLRLKKDKKIGQNMSMNNPAFCKTLHANLSLIIDDLRDGNCKEI